MFMKLLRQKLLAARRRGTVSGAPYRKVPREIARLEFRRRDVSKAYGGIVYGTYYT